MFKQLIVASLVATGIGSHIPAFAASDTVPVRVEPAAAVDVTLYLNGQSPRLLTTTDRTGRGAFNPNIANTVLKGRRFQVRQCRNGLGLVQEGQQTPDGCSGKKLAGYWWGHDETLAVNMAGGGLTGFGKTALVAGAGAGALVARHVLSGDSRVNQQPEPRIERPVEQPPVQQPQPPVEQPQPPAQPPISQPEPPRPPQEDATVLNGIYTGTLNIAGENTCNFAPSTPIHGVLKVDADGRGTWESTHTNVNVTIRFAPIVLTYSEHQKSGEFETRTTQQIGSRNMAVIDRLRISGESATNEQTFQAESGAPCRTNYAGTLKRN